jgi:hypothetical protein
MSKTPSGGDWLSGVRRLETTTPEISSITTSTTNFHTRTRDPVDRPEGLLDVGL